MTPGLLVPAAVLLGTNIVAALTAPILDCDEVFNYWDPTHYLLFGHGLQTWEYSPEYALRSWLYVSLHALAGLILRINGVVDARIIFYGIRVALAAFCTVCQTILLQAATVHFGIRPALLMALMMASTTGFFYASVAYLPSSFAMYASMLALAVTLRDGSAAAKVGSLGVGAIVGWPFCGILLCPLLWDQLWRRRWRVLRSLCTGALLLLPVIGLDVAFNRLLFRRWTFSPWQIVAYNIFGGQERGPEIFGVEAWHFYLRNLLLNFNAWFLLALAAGPLILLLPQKLRTFALTCPFYLWLGVFSAQPHKEERFMYPAYPFLCLNAALALHAILVTLGRIRVQRTAKLVVVALAISTIVLLGVLRTAGSVSAYRAPMRVFSALPEQGRTVCVGKEWYRFPSSFFLPPGMRLEFIKSEFDGLLPGHFSENSSGWLPAAWEMPSGMNDRNEEDVGKYVG